jgi:Na+-translocating ferredoxin:NAD+ oxidoreductase RnfD subunit
MLKKVKRERFVWLDTMLTLLTLELMAYFYYGPRALALAAVCVAFSLAAEIVSFRLMHREFTADDLTCTSDALIIALALPSVMDYRIAAIACVFAVVAAKNVFGGRINMIFSPAAAAYTFMYTSWGRELLQFTEPHVRLGVFDKADDLVSSASYTFNVSRNMDHTDFELLMGNFSGPCGAVSILLLAVAAVILILRRDISAGAFIGTVSGTAALAYLAPAANFRSDSVKYSLVTNMVLFAAVYIVSDKRIAPKRNYYAFFYGLFIAMCSYIIVLTTARENAIMLVSVLFTPVALGFKNLEKRIETAEKEAAELAAQAEAAAEVSAENAAPVTAEEVSADE